MLWKELFAEPAASRLGWVGRIALALIVLGVIVPTFYVFFQTITNTYSYHRVAEQYIGYAMVMGASSAAADCCWWRRGPPARSPRKENATVGAR